MGAHDEGDDDTELAITDDANTAVVLDSGDTTTSSAEHEVGSEKLAWSVEDCAPEVESNRRPLSLSLRLLLICVLVGAVGLSTFVLGARPVLSRHVAATTPTAPVHAPRAAPMLDGTYLVQRDLTKQIENGAPNPEPKGDIVWWAFRSSCRPTDCVATGTELDLNNHRLASNPGHTAEFHFANGHWQREPVRVQAQHPKCLAADGKSVVAGADTRLVTWSLEPQPGGTFGGVLTDTTMTNECDSQGMVLQAPLVATRTGDVALSVSVADPATVVASPTTSTAVSAVAGPRLDGTYRLDENLAKQTANGAPATGDTSDATAWWAFRSLCTPPGCVATGTELGNRNHQEATGRNAAVLRFVDGRWQNAPRLLFGPCTGINQPGADQSATATDRWSWEPHPDGTLGGFSTFTQLTNACGNQGTVYRTPMSLTRVGDVPPSVVLADPALFVE